MTRSPARTVVAAFWRVRQGLAEEPAAVSLPVGATKNVRRGAAGVEAGDTNRRISPDTMDATRRRRHERMIEEGMEPAYESVTPGSVRKRPPPFGSRARPTANRIREMPGRAAMVGGRRALSYWASARGASLLQEATMVDTLYKRL